MKKVLQRLFAYQLDQNPSRVFIVHPSCIWIDDQKSRYRWTPRDLLYKVYKVWLNLSKPEVLVWDVPHHQIIETEK